MTYKEAIEILKRNKPTRDPRLCGKELCTACDVAIEALEKQIPKKPNYEGDGYWNGELIYDTWICPNCGKDYEVDYDKHKHCPECGQAIDRSEEE